MASSATANRHHRSSGIANNAQDMAVKLEVQYG